MSFTFDHRIGRYRDSTSGRLVPEAKVRLAVDAVADLASEQMADVTERLLAGEIRLATWQREMMGLIKVSHVSAGVVAQGGAAQMDARAYGYLGSQIKEQYRFLQNFARDLEAGTLPLDRRLVARAGLYGQHARVTYEAVRARDASVQGYDQEMNILHAAESCPQCRGLAARGWVGLGELPPVGQRTCLARCRCTISRRKSVEVVVPLQAAG